MSVTLTIALSMRSMIYAQENRTQYKLSHDSNAFPVVKNRLENHLQLIYDGKTRKQLVGILIQLCTWNGIISKSQLVRSSQL